MTPSPRLPETAGVHEKTVQEVAKGAVRRRTRRPSKPIVSAKPVTAIRVHPDVWRKAVELAEHPRNIQIISEEEVIVWNHAPPWPT